MSQLSDWRRRVLKKSQEALSEELGYDKWQTYAAQEQGKNPLPEDIRVRLRGKPYKYAGPFPDEEEKPLTKADLGQLRDELTKTRVILDEKIEAVLAALQALGGK